MCGRLTQSSKSSVYGKLLRAVPRVDATPTYNLCPSQPITICRQADERELVAVTWGLVPHWSDEPKTGYNTINARAETVASKPAFRQAYRKRRCLIPTDGYYEWRQTTQKQPYFIHRTDGQPFALAGVWERWEGKGQVIESAAIIVTAGNELMKPIHDRMPVIIDPEDYERWLDPCLDGHKLVPLLVPHTEQGFEAYPISTAVNRPKNNGRELLSRVDMER